MLERSGPDQVGVLEMGGTHLTAARVRAGTWQVEPSSLRRHGLAADGSATEIIGVILEAANGVGAPRGTRWGVAVPEPFDYERGIAQFQGVAKFDSLRGVDLRAAIGEGLVSPPGPITFLNDAEAYLLGEWIAGAATGAGRCAGLTIGTGVGSAFLADGEIVAGGPDVPPCGSLHRTTVDGRPLEDAVSRRAIVRRFVEGGGDPNADVREVAGAARAGDRWAAAVLSDAARTLGGAAAPWLVSFRAELVVVGGSVSKSWDLLEGSFSEGLRAGGAGAVAVRPAAHPDHAGLVGAAWAATRDRVPHREGGSTR